MTGASSEPFKTTIAPWLTVNDAEKAIDFYQAAFGAVEMYRFEGDDGKVAVAQLEVGGAPFWVQEDSESGRARGSTSVRMILSVEARTPRTTGPSRPEPPKSHPSPRNMAGEQAESPTRSATTGS
jgi:catechol 2,3-dioxygenase-like lactoylglutathione lyase family enzyme